MKTETSSEKYETFSIYIQLLQETGYQQQEEQCKSGAMQNTGCLTKEDYTSDQETNLRIHPSKTKKCQIYF